MAAAFLTPLRVEQIGARRWMLIDELHFRSAKYPGVFVAPRGFQTDFCSIPRIAWSIFPKVDVYDRAAVIHDAAYMNALVTLAGDRIFTVKHVADDLFAEGLRAVGVGGLRAWLMVRGVRRFGDPLGHPLAANRAGASAVPGAVGP